MTLSLPLRGFTVLVDTGAPRARPIGGTPQRDNVRRRSAASMTVLKRERPLSESRVGPCED